MTKPPTEGDKAPDFEALLCDGEVFQNTTLNNVIDERGCVLIFYGFSFNAISLNWWKQYERMGWNQYSGISVVGVGRDGPYAINQFLRKIDSPFRVFSDVDGGVARKYSLLTEREGMANASTAKRAVYVLKPGRETNYSWISHDWISPVPTVEVESVLEEL